MRFCFYGKIADAINGITIGGSELQKALLAKSLAKSGHEVVVIDPYTETSCITEEGIKIIPVPNWNKGLPVIGLLFRKLPALYKLLKEQKADFYYARTRSYYHLFSYLAARKTGGKFIMGMASDIDLFSIWRIIKYKDVPSFNLIEFLKLDLPNILAFKYLLRKADYITLQHSGQKILSKSIKGQQGIFPNIFDFNNLPRIQKESGDYFISAGSLTMLKGAKNLLELVKVLDKRIKIVIVGEPRCRKTRVIYEQLKEIENVELKGRLNHRETMQLIGNAKALINVSNFEGFPNIFLEAWAQGIPVISLHVNPGDVINNYGLGKYCEGDIQRMKDYIEADITANHYNVSLISYVKLNHDINSASQRFFKILNNPHLKKSKDHHEDSVFHRLFSRWRKGA